MAVATVANITARLRKMNFPEKEKATGYYQAPKSAKGNEIVIFLPEKFGKKNRTAYLRDSIMPHFKEFNPKFVTWPASKSTAGQISFNGTTLHIIAKMFGKPTNKGILFEDVLADDFNKMIKEEGGYRYGDWLEEFNDKFVGKNDMVTKVSHSGGLNTKRPLKFDSQGLYVSVENRPRSIKIGDGLADLKVYTKKGNEFNLSLKFGDSITFFNSGLGSTNFPPGGAFPLDEFKSGHFTQPVGKGIIDLFQIDPMRFRNVFMNYKEKDPMAKRTKSEKAVEKVKIDQRALKAFTKTVIGSDYLLVHLDKNGKTVHTYDMTPKFLDKAATPLSTTVDIFYPLGGSAKRIDIKFETAIYELNFNIRNKQGGILPSHIMCDYKLKR